MSPLLFMTPKNLLAFLPFIFKGDTGHPFIHLEVNPCLSYTFTISNLC
jgi:hypothetical protein